MTDHLEDLIMTEARRQGYQLNAEAMRKAAVDLCGSNLTAQNLIHMPGKGSISPADFVRSLRIQMPEGFGSLDHEDQAGQANGTLTERYRADIAASRKQARISDADLARFTGITRQHMEERQRAAKAK